MVGIVGAYQETVDVVACQDIVEIGKKFALGVFGKTTPSVFHIVPYGNYAAVIAFANFVDITRRVDVGGR